LWAYVGFFALSCVLILRLGRYPELPPAVKDNL
jgi:hypothetical protein